MPVAVSAGSAGHDQRSSAHPRTRLIWTPVPAVPGDSPVRRHCGRAVTCMTTSGAFTCCSRRRFGSGCSILQCVADDACCVFPARLDSCPRCAFTRCMLAAATPRGASCTCSARSRTLPGGGGGDETAALGRFDLLVEDPDERLALQLPCDQHGPPDGGADPVHSGLDQHAVQPEARGPRQVRRRLALAGASVRPVGVPSQVVEQGPAVQAGRAIGSAERGEQGRAADRQQVLLEERLLEQRVLAARRTRATRVSCRCCSTRSRRRSTHSRRRCWPTRGLQRAGLDVPGRAGR